MSTTVLLGTILVFLLLGSTRGHGTCEGETCSNEAVARKHASQPPNSGSLLLSSIQRGMELEALELWKAHVQTKPKENDKNVRLWFHEALKMGQAKLVEEMLRFFLQEKSNILQEPHPETMCTPLQDAFDYRAYHLLFHNQKLVDKNQPRMNHSRIIELFVRHSTNKRALEPGSGRSAIGQAVTFRDFASISLLLDAGYELEQEDKMGRTPLLIACDLSEITIHISKLLTGHGNFYHDFNGDTVKKDEARYSTLQELELEVDGISTNEGRAFNRTLLDDAIYAWNQRIIDVLLRHNADVKKQDGMGNTALHISAYYGNYLAIEAILKQMSAKMKPDEMRTWLHKRNNFGLVPLEMAATGNYIEAQNALIAAGADTSVLKAFQFYGHKGDTSDTGDCVAGHCGKTVPLKAHKPNAEKIKREYKSKKKSRAASGGWNTQTHSDIDIDHCDIDVLHNPSPEEFYEKYFKYRKPVVVRGANEDWKAFDNWTKQKMLSKYGALNFKTYNRKDGGPPESSQMTLNDYVKYMEANSGKDTKPIWLVDTSLDPGAKSIVEGDISKIPMLPEMFSKLPFGYNNYQFMIAPPYAGASVHFHNSAGNVLVFGKKRWFLFPPSQAFYSVKHIHEWYTEDYPLLSEDNKPLECIQLPGDFMYVPDMWAHGVIYTKDSIGIAFLFTG